ncbi:PRC-barrel domain containing protein [Streptomyces sp. SID1046]|nr:PRC-barrel domain containing protein [Streptomyces sp. SID1046]
MCTSVVITEQLRPFGGTVQTDIDPRSLIGRKAFDRNGTKIGTIDEVYLDDATGVPEWAAVRTGLFSRDAFVPLEPSELVGDTLRVPFERALIRDAPDFGVGRHLSPEQELQLYHHYGLDTTLPADFNRDFGRLAGDES